MRQLIRGLFCFLFPLLLIMGSKGLYAEEPSDDTRSINPTIEKVIAAYGGKDVIEGIHSLYAKGNIEAFMRNDRGMYELYFKRGKKLRVATKYGHSSEVRILNGDRGFRSADTLPPEEVFGPRFVSMVYQYKHLNILHDLIHGEYRIRSAGRSVVHGSDADVFRLNDKEGAVMDVFVDTHTFFIVKVIAYFSAEHKQIDLSVEFSDFRKVEDSVLPFRITNYAGGLKVAETVIEKYSLNPEIADSFFVPSPVQSL
jgi:hypothetical protein